MSPGTKPEMVDGPFVGQAVAQVTIRPRKLAYLIRAGRADDFRKAIRYASTEWGGIGQPVAPVVRKDKITPAIWQQLEVLKPEVMIDYVGVSNRLRDELQKRLNAQVLPEPWLEYDEPGVHNLVAVPPGSLRGRTIFEVGNMAILSREAAIGAMQGSPEADGLWAATGGRRQVIRTALDLLDAQLDVPSPIWTTKQQFRTYESRVVGAPVVIYGDLRPSLNRLIGFWNVRALAAGSDTSVLWLPEVALAEPEIRDRIRTLCLAKLQTVPDLLLLGPDATVLDQRAVAMGFELAEASKSTIQWSSDSRDLIKWPLTYWRRIDPRGFVLGERREGTRAAVPVTVTRPSTVVHVQSPVAFNPTIGGKLRLEIDDIEAIHWPRRAATANLVAPNSTWTAGGLSFVYGPSKSYQLTLEILAPVAVLTTCLSQAGWAWSLSDKGRYASALAGAVTGRTSIASLGDRLSLRIIRELTSLSSKKAGQALRSALPTTVTTDEINAVMTAIVPSLVPRWLTSNELSSILATGAPGTTRQAVVDVLARLLDDGLVRRAFRFRCSNCGLMTHILLDSAQDHVRCEGCTARAPLSGPSGEPELTYGLNSLLDRASDQDCHGHLLVQAWMHDRLKVLWSVPGADLATTTGPGREIDVLGISRDEIVVSEVKNSSRSFTDAVVIDTAKLSRDLLADHLILAATDDWDVHRIDEVTTLARTIVPKVTVLGLAELTNSQT
jgi:hypothetical protein